ncbi:MAG: hypothetical protein WCV79_00330 [Candidatus Paceibacterota bacterium]|jgi:hypothetical protein
MEPNQNQPVNPTLPISNMTPTSHKKVGPIVAILVIVLVLIVAALYLFASKLNKQPVMLENTNGTESAFIAEENSSPMPVVSPVTGTADDPDSLSNDLNAGAQAESNFAF